jgi:hypothetical protein
MEVAVIELRDDTGRKRPRADVLADKPVFGYLILSPVGAYVQAREEAPPTVGAILPCLINPRITRIRRGSMVIVGGYLDPSSRNIHTPPIPQAWWVRPVGHAGIPAS